MVNPGATPSSGPSTVVHVSDDDRRLMVYMKADLPLVNLTFHLGEITEVVPLVEPGGGDGGKVPS